MVVVGAGLVGVATAWLLLNRGHGVCLIDPVGAGEQTADAGSGAALGVLMAQVYRRSSGRGWRLRQRSLQLWQDWSHQLAERGSPLPLRPGLLQLAADPKELELQQRLVLERNAKGFPLRQLSPEELAQLQPQLPDGALGGLFSPLDGQLDPIVTRQRLLQDALSRGLELASDRAEAIGATSGADRWRLHLASGTQLDTPWLLVCAGLAQDRGQRPLVAQGLQQGSTGQAGADQQPGRIDEAASGQVDPPAIGARPGCDRRSSIADQLQAPAQGVLKQALAGDDRIELTV